jgi:hypothetical protein
MFHLSSRHLACRHGPKEQPLAAPPLLSLLCPSVSIPSLSAPTALLFASAISSSSASLNDPLFFWFSASYFLFCSVLSSSFASSRPVCHRYMFRAAIMRDKQPPHSATAVRALCFVLLFQPLRSRLYLSLPPSSFRHSRLHSVLRSSRPRFPALPTLVVSCPLCVLPYRPRWLSSPALPPFSAGLSLVSVRVCTVHPCRACVCLSS